MYKDIEKRREFQKEYQAERRKTDKYKKKQKECFKKWIERHPEYNKQYFKIYNAIHKVEHIARYKLSYAIIKGKIIRPKFCSECNKRGLIYGHHFDYSKPLEVIWLCGSCHRKLHYNLNNIQLLKT